MEGGLRRADGACSVRCVDARARKRGMLACAPCLAQAVYRMRHAGMRGMRGGLSRGEARPRDTA